MILLSTCINVSNGCHLVFDYFCCHLVCPQKNIGHLLLIPHDNKEVLTNPKQKQFCDDIVVTFSMTVCGVTLCVPTVVTLYNVFTAREPGLDCAAAAVQGAPPGRAALQQCRPHTGENMRVAASSSQQPGVIAVTNTSLGNYLIN